MGGNCCTQGEDFSKSEQKRKKKMRAPIDNNMDGVPDAIIENTPKQRQRPKCLDTYSKHQLSTHNNVFESDGDDNYYSDNGDSNRENSRIYQKDGMHIDERDWIAHYELWCKDPKVNTRPGPHPNPQHPWNTHPEMYNLHNKQFVSDDY